MIQTKFNEYYELIKNDLPGVPKEVIETIFWSGASTAYNIIVELMESSDTAKEFIDKCYNVRIEFDEYIKRKEYMEYDPDVNQN